MGMLGHTVDDIQVYVCGQTGNLVRWPKALPGDFVVEIRIKLLDFGILFLVFVFGSGSEMDLVVFDGNGIGKSICLEGAHWHYINCGVATPFGSRAWTTLRFERSKGALDVSIDGRQVLQGIQMKWAVDSLEWRPQQNKIGIEYLRAWKYSHRNADHALLRKSQFELLRWCMSYIEGCGCTMVYDRGSGDPRFSQAELTHRHTVGTMQSDLRDAGPGPGAIRPSTPESPRSPKRVDTYEADLQTDAAMAYVGTDAGDSEQGSLTPTGRRRELLQARAEVKTYLTSRAGAGVKHLAVASIAGFQFGRRVCIDAGTAFEEVGRIASFGSIHLTHPLHYNHSAGAAIVMLEEPPHGGSDSVQTNFSTALRETADGMWSVNTAQGGLSGRNAATILRTLASRDSSRRSSPTADDEEVCLHPDVSYALH